MNFRQKTGVKYLVVWVFFSSTFCFHFQGWGQVVSEENNLAILSGYILSKDSLKPIANASIVNSRSKSGTISNPFGYFSIGMNVGDTISFSSVGYAPYHFHFKRDLLAKNYNLQVLMSSDTVELKTFVFRDYSRQELQKQFSHYLTADSLKAFEELSRRATLKNRNILYNATELSHPISYFYDRFNQNARTWRKIDRYRYIIEKAAKENSLLNKNTTNDYYTK